MQNQSLLIDFFPMGLYQTLMLLIFIYLFVLFVCVLYTYTHSIDMEVRKQFAGVGSLHPP